ncbi:hypothetical protein Tco_1111883, partial [Tanacetum coccineum]
MASSSGMIASSSRSINTCSNEFCGRSMAVALPGWKSGDRQADLCYQCFHNQFCSVYHKTLKGWKTCRSCQKDFHCGCFASSSLYDEKDSEFECRGCVAKHANLNQKFDYEETNDGTTITPSPRANGDTTIILTPRINDDTITPNLPANGGTTITPTPHVNGDTITLTPRDIDDTTVTPTPRVSGDTITPTPHAIDDTTITPTPHTIITPTARANHDATITQTPRALDQNATEPSSKTGASAQTRE